jgi:carboxyl-terminal processing protease
VTTGLDTELTVILAELDVGQKPHTEFFGIGAVLESKPGGGLEIQKIMEGAPSTDYGLQQGDRIMAVDGEPTSQLGMRRSVELIRGEEGASVDLEIQRPGDPYPFTVKIVRGRVVYENR